MTGWPLPPILSTRIQKDGIHILVGAPPAPKIAILSNKTMGQEEGALGRKNGEARFHIFKEELHRGP